MFKKLKIMYICPLYFNGRVSYDAFFSDIVMIDWQLRFINHINNLGHKVFVKQHPESETKMPGFFFDELGCKNIVGPFEKVYKKADILLADFPGSSAFGYALETDKPIIYIDFGIRPLYPNEYKSLKKRCYIVKGSTNRDNRLIVDWRDFSNAFSSAHLLNDRTYLEKILGL